MTLSLVLLLSGCVLRSEADWDRDGDGLERFRDCDDDDPLVGELLWYLDGDGDGVGSGEAQSACVQPSDAHVQVQGDCDDSDPEISPLALEVCNGVDDDCDDLVDDRDSNLDPDNAATWYQDFDGDGVGTDQVREIACEQPPGFVAEAGDCDDRATEVNPNAQEICDADDVDEDCDGRSDDLDSDLPGKDGGGSYVRYRDQDGDGSGDAGSMQTFCDSELQEGWSETSLDCDDLAPAIYPGAKEICGDAQDMNCDGVRTCVFVLGDAQGTISAGSGESGENFGVCLTGHDPVGTSKEKLYVGESLFDTSDAFNAGRIHVYREGLGELTFDDATALSEGSYSQGLAGFYIEDYGPYLAISAVGGGAQAGGVVYLNQLSKAPLELSGEAGSNFGSAIGFGGGLKTAAVAIGASGYSGSGDSQGRVYLFETVGLGEGPAEDQAVAWVTGEQDNDQIGKTLALLDGNGDGDLDLVFGSFAHDEAESNTGAYYVWMGPQSGALSAEEVTRSFFGDKGDKLGTQVAKVGDVNGDAYPDAIVCAVEADWRGDSQAGYCALAYGGATGALNPDGPKIGGEAGGDKLGSARAWDLAGDINGDGVQDLALSSSSAGGGDGAVYVFFGPLPESGVVSAGEANLIFDGAGSDAFGGNFEFMDFEGDGKQELAVSARLENMVYIFGLYDLLEEPR